MSDVAYLSCPECGEDAIPSSAFGCLGCIDGAGEHECDSEPLWNDGDGGKCPGCGVMLRVSVDDDRAWASIVETPP